jgi:hypothetical protein
MHVFLSYARADSDFARWLTSVLHPVGIHLWIDSAGLPPGTVHWDRAIRGAIQESHGVIALCSEAARESQFVATELEIAKGYQKPIVPVWVSGTEWSQSAPVSLVLSQHLDLRGANRGTGASHLIEAKKRHLAAAPMPNGSDKWPFLRVVRGESSTHVNPFAFPNWGEMLGEVYLSLLKDEFPPFSYGELWALEISASTKPFDFWSWPIFALPAKWAQKPFTGVHEVDLDWVHATGIVEAVAILSAEEARGRSVNRNGHKVRSTARVIDLRTLREKVQEHQRGLRERPWDERDPSRNFIGVQCGWSVFDAFAAGAHPKMTYMRISGALRRGEERSQCEEPPVAEPRYEFVTVQTDYFDRHMLHRLPHTVPSPGANVIVFP